MALKLGNHDCPINYFAYLREGPNVLIQVCVEGIETSITVHNCTSITVHINNWIFVKTKEEWKIGKSLNIWQRWQILSTQNLVTMAVIKQSLDTLHIVLGYFASFQYYSDNND